MFFLGITAILQIFFFPGLITLHQLKFKSRLVAKIVITIALSLVINYCLVFFLTAVHLYCRTTLILIILGETILILFQNREALQKPLEFWLNTLKASIKKSFSHWKESLGFEKDATAFHFFLRMLYLCFCLFLAYVSLNWIWKLFIWNIGGVFNSYDTIRSWGEWAIEWSNNAFPISTNRYPQLLPTNWSIIFTLIGNSSIQFFAQSIMPVFTLLIIIMIIDLGFYKKNPGFFLASAITYLIYKKFLGSFIVEGLGDLLCAFLAFSAIYLLFIFQDDPRPFQQKRIYGYLMLICAAGSAVTKQVGLLFFALFLVMFVYFYIKPFLKIDKKAAIRAIVLCLLLIIIIIVPWYGYNQILIWKGMEKSEVGKVINATQYAYDYGGVKTQLIDVIRSMGKYFYLLLLIIPMSFFMEPVVIWINISLIIPLFISWGLFASYDFRNLSIALPLLGVSSGLSIQYIINALYKIAKRISVSKIPLYFFYLLLAISVLLTGIFIFPEKALEEKQVELTMNEFSPVINQEIMSILKNEDESFTIVTNYPVASLPGMADNYVNILFDNYDDYELTLQRIEEKDIYLLVPKYSNQLIMDEISMKIKEGDYLLLLDDDSWIPYLLIKVVNR